MATGSGDYREKYLRALEEQERLEKQFNIQIEFLRKTVINLSAAASGLDKNLDAEMMALKEKLRGAKGGQVIEQMERVQRAVTLFEQSRDSENALAAKTMIALLEQYRTLKIPSGTKKKLQIFSNGIKQSLKSYRLYPSVLVELGRLQQLAFDAAAEAPKSFWQRLKPGRELKSEESLKEPEETVIEGTLIERDETLKPVSDGEEMELSCADLEAEIPVYETRISRHFDEDEDSYEQVAARIGLTLQGLIDKIQPNDIVKHKVDIVRIRIKRGMDWFALAATLEDIRDILLLRYLDVDKEFSDYLKQVNDELLNISEALGVVVDRENEQRDAAGKFCDTVSSQVAKLQSSMAQTENIDTLKQEVNGHLGLIQEALGQYRSIEGPADHGSLTDQLKALVERVHSIENESVKTKELLEEERYKATHDTLTSLPNREAYNERAFLEVQRFKRYGRPLTMAVCDVDHFKRINDNYGHQSGDKVLKLIARILSTRLRKVDFVARYGGEEFVILMPETPAKQALTVLDKIRAAIGKSAFRFKDEPVTITISFGIAPLDVEDTVESAFARADDALYEAKNKGRNQCVISAYDVNENKGESKEKL